LVKHDKPKTINTAFIMNNSTNMFNTSISFHWLSLTNISTISQQLVKLCGEIKIINENVGIKFTARRVSRITFIKYAQNRKIGKPSNLKFWEQ